MKMKSIRWTNHAEIKARQRAISHDAVIQAIQNPDQITPGHFPRSVYSKRYYDEQLQVDMLLRIIVEESESELIIISAYKTSKIAKYIHPVKTRN